MSSDGKELEKLVALIEESVAPGSTVLHDVQMPVLASRIGATRQCDVVITTGQKPRETITIVEVQDRNRRVDRNTFGGWVGKMHEIGAQHLICVSRKEFPESIKEQARHSGTAIRLMTLHELPVDRLPLDFVAVEANLLDFRLSRIDVNFVYSKSEADSLGILESMRDRSTSPNQDVNEKCFSVPGRPRGGRARRACLAAALACACASPGGAGQSSDKGRGLVYGSDVTLQPLDDHRDAVPFRGAASR